MIRRRLAQVIADGLVPLALMCALSAAMAGELLHKLSSRLIGGGPPITPSDVNGTIWFYWWAQRALRDGVDLLHPDVICAPSGQALGSNFPQHIDAHMAGPFLDLLPFPLSYNLFVLTVPVLGGLGAYAGFRLLGLGRVLSLMVAALFGFNAFSIHELANGKPASALVFTLPIVCAAWIRCLRAPGRRVWPWIVVAGFAGAVAIQQYVLYALLIAFFAAGVGILHIWRPAPRVAPARVVVAVLLVTGLATALSAPYLTRLLGDRRPMPAVSETLRLDSPAVLREQRESIDMTYPLWVDADESLPRRAAFPAVLTLFALLLLPLGGRRYRRWLAAGVGFYLLSLGPLAAVSVRPQIEWFTVAGRGVPLPTWWLNQIFPFSIQFFHPSRVFPMVVLCAAGAVGFGLQWACRDRPRWLAPGLGAIIGAIGLAQVHAAGGTVLLHAEYAPHPFISQLGAEPGDFAIIEFPVGLGHATAPAQLIHQKRRSESHHDLVAQLRSGEPPEDCLTLPFLQALWDWSRAEPWRGPRPSPASAEPAAVYQAYRAGFRYLIAWRAGFDMLRQAGIPIDREGSIARLTGVLGAPVFADDTLVAWTIPPTGQP
jgi:hypothetical protein